MNYKNKLNQIRVVLGLQVKLATAKLKDGTVVEAEEFVPGAALVVVAEDGSKSPAPTGEHTLEDGTVVLVDESGAIVSLKPLEAAEEVEEVVEEEAKKVKMEEEGSESVVEDAVKEAIAEKIEEAMKKVMMAMEPLVTEMADMKSKMAKMEESYAKFAKAPAAGKITTINDSKMEFNQSTDIVDRFKELKNSL
jgi:uncharacterized protein YaaW (UPF0174 family)